MIDLTVDFAGINSPNPFWLASSPATNNQKMVERALKCGWGGAVWKTVVDEKNIQIANPSPRLAAQKNDSGKFLSLENIELVNDQPLEKNLEEIYSIKRMFPERVIIVSMMAENDRQSWQSLTGKVLASGCDGVELNISCPHGMPEKGLGMAAGRNIETVKQVCAWVKAVCPRPVIVKLSPNVGGLGQLAEAAKFAGADGLAAINTLLGIIGVDLETLTPLPNVEGRSSYGGISGPAIKPIALRIVCELYQHKTGLPISGMGGVSSWKDGVEFILLGAATVQLCTAVLENGYGIIDDLVNGLKSFMSRKGLRSVQNFIGLAAEKIVSYQRLNKEIKIVPRIDHRLCNQCNRCYVSCRDAGGGAINLGGSYPAINEKLCNGCGLCALVCPEKCVSLKELEIARKN